MLYLLSGYNILKLNLKFKCLKEKIENFSFFRFFEYLPLFQVLFLNNSVDVNQNVA